MILTDLLLLARAIAESLCCGCHLDQFQTKIEFKVLDGKRPVKTVGVRCVACDYEPWAWITPLKPPIRARLNVTCRYIH
jgi:hypothetical protein